MKNQISKTVSILGFTHLLVDLSCIFVLYFGIIQNNTESSLAFTMIVLYNILAFGLQGIIGNFFDKNKQPKLCAIIGCILTGLAVISWNILPVATILAGLGNAFFHVGGGIICLKLSDGKASIPGIYVAPGALGLFLGALAAKTQMLPPYIFTILLIFCAILIKKIKYETQLQKENNKQQINGFLLILNCLLLAIVIRSFIGFSITLDWKSNTLLALCLTLAVVGGKMFGGIIADKLGWMKTTILALLISSPLIAFGINYPILYIIGIFFFNFTMPVTLSAIVNIMKGREGFAFGLTTLALIIGAFPVFYNVILNFNNANIIFIIIIASALLIYFGLKQYFKEIKI